MENATIETFTGKMFDLVEPKVEDVDIRDIAHALSNLCRFTGHTKHHYSVAQHSWLGSFDTKLVDKQLQLEFLLHDASEAYLNDMSRPLKHMTQLGQFYRPVEANIMRQVRAKFNLLAEQPSIIHLVDNGMLWAEKKQLMGRAEWSRESILVCEAKGEVADVIIDEYPPKIVEQLFLARFDYLTGEKFSDYIFQGE